MTGRDPQPGAVGAARELAEALGRPLRQRSDGEVLAGLVRLRAAVAREQARGQR